jgi:hypothetical protein
MSVWFRVFGTNEVQPEPAGVIEQVRCSGIQAEGRFYGDDQGWFQAELRSAQDMPFLQLERFLAKEEGIRAQLNTWAAWLETVEHNPNHGWLMQHVIGTSQLFTMAALEGELEFPQVRAIGVALCQYLARETVGVYQVDDQGFFAADGNLLLEEAI